MKFSRRIITTPWVQRAIGVTAAEYLRLVFQTSRFTLEPPDFYRLYDMHQPVIVGMWHGQHFLLPFFGGGYPGKVLISRHADGEINAIAAERLGVGTVRGSGDHFGRFHIKGGVGAFRIMVDVLAEGCNLAMTADVPKVGRVAGLGIIKLAAVSGRPIFPVALTTSRRIVLGSWDRAEINLPLSRGALVVGEPVHVPADPSAKTLETARATLEQALNAVTERARVLVDRRPRTG